MISVKKDECTGCGLCVSICPDVFEMDEDDKAKVLEPESDAECTHEAAENCPVEAIVIS